MGFIELHKGCSEIIQTTPVPGMCFGPNKPYYTIFGTELRHLGTHLFVAILLGLALLGLLFVLKKKGKISLPNYAIYLIPILSIIVLFFLFALLFPVRVMY